MQLVIRTGRIVGFNCGWSLNDIPCRTSAYAFLPACRLPSTRLLPALLRCLFATSVAAAAFAQTARLYRPTCSTAPAACPTVAHLCCSHLARSANDKHGIRLLTASYLSTPHRAFLLQPVPHFLSTTYRRRATKPGRSIANAVRGSLWRMSMAWWDNSVDLVVR